IVSSPISNVVNASCDGYVYCALNGDIEPKKMSRLESIWFFIQKTISNFRTDLAKDLPDDSVYGHTYEPARPAHIPTDAKWLGGIGEGGWFHLELNPLSNPLLTKFGSDGEIEFERQVISTTLDHNKPLHITYDTHASKLTIIQNGTTKEFELEEIPNLETSDTTRGTNIINNKDQINITNALQHSEI